MRKIFLTMIHFYRHFISSLTPPTYRFYLACSEYTRGAIQYRGVFKGLYLGTRRILECHPFHKGGFDLVPLKKDKSASKHSHKHNR